MKREEGEKLSEVDRGENRLELDKRKIIVLCKHHDALAPHCIAFVHFGFCARPIFPIHERAVEHIGQHP